MRVARTASAGALWRCAVVLALTVLGSVGGFAAHDARAAAADPEPVPGPVVFIGTSGVRWSDVTADATPALWSLLESGASGTIAPRSIRAYACPADGWLAISAGRIAAEPPTTATTQVCSALDQPDAGKAPADWARYVEQAEADGRSAVLGTLGATLADAGIETVGIGPGAAIALAGLDGVPVGPVEALPDDAAAITREVAAAAAAAALVVVDVGSVHTDAAASRIDQVARVEASIAAALGGVPPGATVLVTSLADDGTTPHLQVAFASGPAPGGTYADALLASHSTRQPGLVQVTDVPPTLTELLGVSAPDTFVGAPITPMQEDTTTAAERLQLLRDYDAAAHAVRPAVIWFFVGLGLLMIALFVAATIMIRRSGTPGGSARTLRWLQRGSIVLAAVPGATYPAVLLPWWRMPLGELVLVLSIAVVAVVVAVIALGGPWRRALLGPPGVVGAATALILAVDAFTGSRLIISSLMGEQPLVGGRFYGFGNVPFALFAAGSLVAATALADPLVRQNRRGLAILAVLSVGVVATLVDGLPGLGSDFGGPLALVPAFGTLALLLARVRASWRLALGLVVGAVAVVALLAVLDWLRAPADRTHLGRFIDGLLAGEGAAVVRRKLAQNLDLMLSWTGPLIVAVTVLLFVVVLVPERVHLAVLRQAYDEAPALRPGLVSILVLLALGTALNDSGAAVPAVIASLVLPLLVAIACRVAGGNRPESGGAGSAATQPVADGERPLGGRV